MEKPPSFVVIDQKAIDRRIFTQHFACQLNRCKGACCVQGEAGAPLEPEEATALAEHLEQIRPFVTPRGQATLEQTGAFVRTLDNDLETPLIDGQECAYAFFEEGVARCGIEAAFEAGEIPFQKPISCHLYPIRTYRQSPFEYLVYEEWDICCSACTAGEEQGIRVYEFVRDALIRKYGIEFFNQIDEIRLSMHL